MEGQTTRTPNFRSEADKIRASGGVIEFSIADNESLSDVLRINGRRAIAIEMPAGWDAAVITFLAGADPGAMKPVYDDGGTEISVAVAASRVIGVTGGKADAIMSLDYIQLRSGTVGAPVQQTEPRTLKLLVK